MNLRNLILALSLITAPVLAQKSARQVSNPFFTLHNGIRGDSVYNTPAKQVTLIKEIGYAGMEINQLENFLAFKPEMVRQSLPITCVYFKVDLDEPALDARLPEYVRSLRNSGTILLPYVISSKKTYAPSDTHGDPLAVRRLTELADLAQANGLQVALYPHIWFWLERMPHTLSLVRQVNRPNLGLAFNLPHYLALAKPEERDTWPSLLTECKSYLKLMTICGATPTDEINSKKIWDYLIQPLGQGSFDTFGLVRFAIRELGYTGSIGLQSFNLKGNKPDNLRQSMAVWRTWKQKLEAQP